VRAGDECDDLPVPFVQGEVSAKVDADHYPLGLDNIAVLQRDVLLHCCGAVIAGVVALLIPADLGTESIVAAPAGE
jgi:hypothetical protein